MAAAPESPAIAVPQARAVPDTAGQEGLVTLRGNVRPEAVAANDQGPVADDIQFAHLMLQLQRTPQQEQALQQFIKDVHDPASPFFHHWITAAEFGRQYGVSPADVARVTDWLQSQGFKVNFVYPNQMVIDFSGSAGVIRQAFHTEIHHLLVNGQRHIANMSDPQIPAELASVVSGIVSLNDFMPRSMLVPQSMFTTGSGQYRLVPADLWTIYNFLPAFAAGYSGQGQTIVVLEDSDLSSAADWNTFRSTFSLASAYPGGSMVQVHPASTPVNNCIDPGVNNNENEATVDVEWASAAAPSATITLASCLDTPTGFGGFVALQNLLNASGTPPAIVSVSYGESEPALGASYNAYIDSLYQQAVAEGVSIFVSSGDSGPATSDRGNNYAQFGINVSGYTSTPYNVSVGGTDFADTYQGNNAAYWNPVNAANYGSALSYIPEIPWNDSCASVLIADWERILPTYGSSGLCSQAASINQGEYLNTIAGGGGASGCATGAPDLTEVVGGTCAGYAKPLWQSGLLGNPSDGVRDIPDVSLFAGSGIWGHFYTACFSDTNYGGKSCSSTPDTWSGFGGTSISAPIMAGIQALANQASGSRWGNPNPTYYALAAQEYGSSGSTTCNSVLGNQVANDCIFNDVTRIPLLYTGTGTGGDTDLPCGWLNCYLPTGPYGVLSTAPQTVSQLQLLTLGNGYTSAPTCTISGGGGSGAACTAILTGVVNSVALTNGGSGYTSFPTCTLTGGGGTGATCGVGTSITYPPGTGFVSQVVLLTYGSGYTSAPTCTISGGGGTGATCTATVASGVAVSLSAGGSGYTTMPHCAIDGGGGTGATCMALEVGTSNAYQPAFSASAGWDFATGIGTVNASNLVASFVRFSASLSPPSLTFLPQVPFTTSTAQSVTLTNTGTANLAILAVTVGGANPLDFAKGADTCTGSTLVPNGTCTVSVAFTPTYVGSRSASLNFTDAARQSQNSVTLSGTGAGAGVSISPLSLTFPDQIVGTSTTQTVTLTNPGNVPLSLGNIVITGNDSSNFSQSNNCGSVVGPGATCAINVIFTPLAPGNKSAAITISDNALDSPQMISLTGFGAVPVPFLNQPLMPPSVAPGGSGFTLTVTGTGFASGATVNWNGVPLTTSCVNSMKLTATVPAANIASPGTAQITVTNPGSALVSNAILFSVTPYVPVVTFVNAPGSPMAAGTEPNGIAAGDFNSDGRLDLAVANIVSDSVTILLSNGDGTFTPATSPLPTGVFPESIVTGDFNGDGKLDLVISNVASQNLTILLGNGDGTFTPAAVSPAVGIQPGGVTTGDFNGDGRLDIAVVNSYSNGVTILLGNGDGTFTRVATSSATGNLPYAVAVGDFNGDGKLDLAVANAYGNSLTILLGNGDGTFAPAAASPATGSHPGAIAVGDLNGDGKLDLAVANTSANNLTILLGNGDGTFTAAASPATGVAPIGIALGDLNGDGKLDLAITNQLSGNVTTLVGNGDGTFTPSASSPATGQYPAQIALGDFNGDGKLDLATPNNGTNNVSVLLQSMSGPVAGLWPAALTFPMEPVGNTSPAESITVTNIGNAPLAFTAIGVTGPFAIAGGTTCSTSTPVAAAGTCTVEITFSPTASGEASGTLSFADNAPGSPRNVSLSGTGTTAVVALSPSSLSFVGQGTGTTSPAQSVTLTNTGAANVVISAVTILGTNAGDFAKTVDTCTGATVFPGATCGVSVTFTPSTTGNRTATLSFADNAWGNPQTVSLIGLGYVPVPFLNPALAPASVAPGGPTFKLTVTGTNFVSGASVDWNGAALATTYVSNEQLTATVPAANIASQGTAAISVVNPGAGLSSNVVYLPVTASTSTVTFISAKGSPITLETNPSSIAVGDFNRDGKLDMAVANSGNNSLSILLGNGDGTFTPTAASPSTGSYPLAIATGDFNGDGNLDLAVVNFSGNNLTILLGDGNGTFTPVASSPGTWSSPYSIAAADLNGDGKLDLVVVNEGTNLLNVLLGNGNGTFTPVTSPPSAGSTPLSVAIGDFNKDGKLDLAVANEGNNSLTILLGNGDGTFTPAASSPATGDDPEFVAVADFNGDGTLDLAVANFLGGVTILLGNGDGTFTPTVSPSSTGSAPLALAVGDLNGDGRIDMALVTGPGCTVLVLLGNGDGTFTPNPTSPSTGSSSASIAVGDFNGDGRLDLATGPDFDANSISVFLQAPFASAGVSAGSLTFGSQNVGTTSVSQPVTLTSAGTGALTITSIITSANFGQKNDCGSSLAASASCTINVTFSPKAAGTIPGTLTITDNSNGVEGTTQTVSLSGTGTAPLVSLSSSSLTFAGQVVGTASPAQTVTVTNPGTANLNISTVTIAGLNPGDFTKSSDACTGATVIPNGTCTVTVTFAPAASGSRSATLSFADDAPGSPQTVILSGTGEDFTLTASSTTQTITRGQTANYTLSVAGQSGLSGTVSFTCSGAPSEAACTVSPNPATLGSSPGNVTVTVTTTAPTIGTPRFPPVPPVRPRWPDLRLLTLALLLAAAALAIARRNQPRVRKLPSAMVVLVAELILTAALVACGGGGGGGGGGGSITHDPGTPAGTYTLTVTATTGSGSSSLNHAITLTLTVN